STETTPTDTTPPTLHDALPIFASPPPYAIVITSGSETGTGLSNYNISYVDGSLTVNKANLQITANSDSKTYGTLKTFASTAFTQTGLVTANGDTLTGVTETSTEAPGTALTSRPSQAT